MKKSFKVKNIWKSLIKAAAFLLVLSMPFHSMAALIKVPVDTTIENDRNAGTDLYDTKCYYKNVLPLDISLSTGGDTSILHDEKYSTSMKLDEGTLITVKSDTVMHGIYIIWDTIMPEWTLKIGEESYTY